MKPKSQDAIQIGHTQVYSLLPAHSIFASFAVEGTCYSFKFQDHSYILVLPQLLLSTVILHHKPCLHLASTLPILIFLLLVMGPIVAMKLLLALEVKNCLWCQSTCLLLNRTPIVGLSRLNMVRFTIFRYLCKIHFSHVFIPF